MYITSFSTPRVWLEIKFTPRVPGFFSSPEKMSKKTWPSLFLLRRERAHLELTARRGAGEGRLWNAGSLPRRGRRPGRLIRLLGGGRDGEARSRAIWGWISRRPRSSPAARRPGKWLVCSIRGPNGQAGGLETSLATRRSRADLFKRYGRGLRAIPPLVLRGALAGIGARSDHLLLAAPEPPPPAEAAAPF